MPAILIIAEYKIVKFMNQLTMKFLIRDCLVKQREHCFEVFWTDIAFSKGISLAKKGTYFSRSNIEKAKTR